MGTVHAVRTMRLGWQEFGARAEELARRIERGMDGRGRYDIVVSIARGGTPLAMVLADRLDADMQIIDVKSYKGINERVEPQIMSKLKANLRGRRVLVVDDLVDEGHTLQAVVAHVKEKGAVDVATAVMFRKPWTNFEPDFHSGVTKRWVIFPWEEGEYKRLMRK
ncbi:MAG: phosphoribosyltransferase [Candidatus Micrarchaeota archaeon]|nr:phosphoribosyltransferase [Candidatus Micrarchaeota archaeon]